MYHYFLETNFPMHIRRYETALKEQFWRNLTIGHLVHSGPNQIINYPNPIDDINSFTINDRNVQFEFGAFCMNFFCPCSLRELLKKLHPVSSPAVTGISAGPCGITNALPTQPRSVPKDLLKN